LQNLERTSSRRDSSQSEYETIIYSKNLNPKVNVATLNNRRKSSIKLKESLAISSPESFNQKQESDSDEKANFTNAENSNHQKRKSSVKDLNQVLMELNKSLKTISDIQGKEPV